MDGNWNFPLTKFEHFLISLLTFFSLCDFAYIRRISSVSKTSKRRLVISSQAAFEFAQTRTHLRFDPRFDRTISSIVAIKVRVLPVPKNKYLGSYMNKQSFGSI